MHQEPGENGVDQPGLSRSAAATLGFERCKDGAIALAENDIARNDIGPGTAVGQHHHGFSERMTTPTASSIFFHFSSPIAFVHVSTALR